jgi:methylated-DNA-[protein]-cysteine S-methyltransferase
MPGLMCRDLNQADCSWVLEHVAHCGHCRKQLHEYEQACGALDKCLSLPFHAPLTPPKLNLPLQPSARYGRVESPVGPLFVAASDRGLCEIGYGSNEPESKFQEHLRQRGFRPVADANAIQDIAKQLHEYFGGQRNRFDVPLDFSGISPFTQTVLSATANVGYGQLMTYRDIAVEVGRPGASRAVGNALGRNPIPVIVPCHRIVRSDNSLGGYTGGIEIKERLLSLEGVYLTPSMLMN